MDPQIRQEEEQKLHEILLKLVEANKVLEGSMKNLSSGTLDRLKELRDDPEAGLDFFVLMEQLHEKNAAFDFKDKFQRLEEFEYLMKEPYFARIDLHDPADNSESKLYIGKFGYTEHEPVITDWRAKIASVYYRYRYPQKDVKYDTPDGIQTRDLTLKRTYEIEDGELVKYYNNDIQLDESEIIIDKLEQRTGGVLEDIVETIQISQLDIIESDPRQVCIVQGCVGSGKSTVAIHKLAHIFFNFPNIIHPERSILVTKNQILIGYLSTLFPKLGIFDIYYKTLRELTVHLVFREELSINIDLSIDEDTSDYTIEKYEYLIGKVAAVHNDTEVALHELFSNPEFESFGGFKYSRLNTPYANVSEIMVDLEEEIMSHKEFIKENPNSLRSTLYKDNIKTMRKIISKLSRLKEDIKHSRFPAISKELGVNRNEKLGYKETLLYVLLYTELVGISKFPQFEYCVVDEGQDFSILEYAVLSKLVLRGRFAIFGDLNQSLESDGITKWEDIPKVVPEAKNASVFELSTNYRSTKPIIDLANNILSKYTDTYLPKSINRKGPEPTIELCDTYEDMISKFKNDISSEMSRIDKSIGVICFGEDTYSSAEQVLDNCKIEPGKLIKLDSTMKIHYIPKGVYLTRFEDCKGLEFSKVYILNLNLKRVTDFSEARKAFVAVTRAMNEVCIFGLN